MFPPTSHAQFFDLSPENRILNSHAAVALSWAYVDHGLKSHFSFVRNPISAPNIFLPATRFKQRRFAVRVKNTAACQHTLPYIDSYFNIFREAFQHLLHLTRRRFFTYYMNQ